MKVENNEQSKKIQSEPSGFAKIGFGIFIFIAVFYLARSIYFPFTPEGQRRAQIQQARIHARTVVQPMLAKDKRFDEVFVSEWYKDDGYFRVKGAVETEADLKDLKTLIMATHPPAPVAWFVEVAETNSATNNLKN